MAKTVHVMVYVKRSVGSGRNSPSQLGDFAEFSLLQPGGHGFGQRWLFDLLKNDGNLVIWLFSLIRYKNLCLPPSLDARILATNAFGPDTAETTHPYIKWLLSEYKYAFQADPDPEISYYLPWNDATPVLNKIFPDVSFHTTEPEVIPFSNYSAVMTHFQSPRRIDASKELLLEDFANKVRGRQQAFISYRRKEAPVFAMQTAARMYHHGVAPWWDQWAMPRKVAEEDAMLSSQSMIKALGAAIGRSKYAVTLHTHDYASVSSRWTKFELEKIKCASIKGKIKHVPIKVENELLVKDSKVLIDYELQKQLTDTDSN